MDQKCIITTNTKGHRPHQTNQYSGYDVQEVIDAIDYWKAHDAINSTIPSKFLSYAMNPEGFDNELYFNMNNNKQKEIANNSKCIAVAMGMQTILVVVVARHSSKMKKMLFI